MWFESTLISCLLICNSCLTVIANNNFAGSEIESKNQSKNRANEEDASSNMASESIRKHIRFDDLNDDVLYLIVIELSLPDLLSVFQIKTRLAYYASKAFAHKYRNYDLIIFQLPDNEAHKRETCIDHVYHKRLVITAHTLALDMLKHFGDVIQHLEIHDQTLAGNNSIAINRMANEYTFASLTRLHLNGANAETFAQFTKSFEQVNELSCSIHQTQTGNILPLNEIFPNLQKFTLSINPDIDYRFFDCHMPCLERLDISVTELQFTSNHSQLIANVLRKNAHVQAIKLRLFPSDYIVTVNQFVPNLVSLTTDQFNIHNNFVHMENVNNFTLHTALPRSIDRLTFARLEAIKFIYDPEMFNEWMTFFGNHQHLKRLTFKMLSNVAINDHLHRILLRLLGLIELTMINVNNMSIEDIMTIVRVSVQLVRFNIQINKNEQFDIATLREQLNIDWKTSIRPMKYGRIMFCFEKRI